MVDKIPAEHYLHLLIFLSFRTEHGYITGYNEDGTHLGPFNWRLLGFTSPPTDYYPIPFFRRTKTLMKGADQCVGGRNVNQYQYDFIRSFFKVFSNNLKFFVSFSGECTIKIRF